MTVLASAPPAPRVLTAEAWQPLAHAHAVRVDDLTRGHLDRASRGQRHPTDDFLWDYYRFRPGQLRRWHPGAGTGLLDAGDRAGWRFHRTTTDGAVTVDVASFLAVREESVRSIRELLARTAERESSFACFCLHEWAMVYGLPEDGVRHPLPLRLGQPGTDRVVEAHTIRCTHAEAVRYFTPDALPRNTVTPSPTRETQADQEQPGCLHATMDLYMWAYKLTPAVPSDLVLSAFELAIRARALDMAASPYDARSLGVRPVPIETPEGKAAFVAGQREIAEAGQRLRTTLLGWCDALLTEKA